MIGPNLCVKVRCRLFTWALTLNRFTGLNLFHSEKNIPGGQYPQYYFTEN